MTIVQGRIMKKDDITILTFACEHLQNEFHRNFYLFEDHKNNVSIHHYLDKPNK